MRASYRIGQTKNVIVYRCVTCGTIEEKMYARQVWKQCLNKKVIENKHTLRHFSKDELKDLFQLNDPQHSAMRANIAVFPRFPFSLFRSSVCRSICPIIRVICAFCSRWISTASASTRSSSRSTTSRSERSFSPPCETRSKAAIFESSSTQTSSISPFPRGFLAIRGKSSLQTSIRVSTTSRPRISRGSRSRRDRVLTEIARRIVARSTADRFFRGQTRKTRWVRIGCFATREAARWRRRRAFVDKGKRGNGETEKEGLEKGRRRRGRSEENGSHRKRRWRRSEFDWLRRIEKGKRGQKTRSGHRSRG